MGVEPCVGAVWVPGTRVVLFFLFIFILLGKLYAQDIPQQTAIHIIVAEASDQGLKGMVCVGEVLRHRGSPKGFSGYLRHVTRVEPQSIWDMAAQAWKLSAHTNYTKGADHFENVRRFGLPRWAKDCVVTYSYKDHVFFKEIHRNSN